jgi:hypothetical protein
MNKNSVEGNIKRYYPDAAMSCAVDEYYLTMMESQHGVDQQKILLATSLCSDDINTFCSDYFCARLLGPFNMGGLGGLPFAGMTGMVAYSHHVPDDGTAFIFYGPHVGITDDGELGKMIRPGQSKLTSSCGALMAALKKMESEDKDHPYSPVINGMDIEQSMLEQYLMPYKSRILSSDNSVQEITEVAYEIIDRMIKTYVQDAKSGFCCKNIVLLGGIVLNTSPEIQDYIEVRNFEVINL